MRFIAQFIGRIRTKLTNEKLILSDARRKQKGSGKIKWEISFSLTQVSKKKKKSHSLYCITRASKSCGIKSYYKERNWSVAPEPLQLHSFSLQPQDLEFRHKARLYQALYQISASGVHLQRYLSKEDTNEQPQVQVCLPHIKCLIELPPYTYFSYMLPCYSWLCYVTSFMCMPSVLLLTTETILVL